MTDVVLVERKDGVAWVIINRPEKMNALNLPVWQGVGDAFLDLAKDESVRCVVLRGSGRKAFAPGADIDEFDSLRATPAQAKTYDLVMRRALAAAADCPKPTLVMIHGPCVGGGLELACQCDIRIAGRSARFGVPIARIGVVMAHPELAGIARLIGPARALEILLEAKVIDAATALEWGLLARVTDDAELEAEIKATAERILAGSPLAHKWHKSFIRRLNDPSPVSEAELGEAYRFLETEDYREGVAAFLAKRKPEFKGK
jgi:enoyl-CoA hydratase